MAEEEQPMSDLFNSDSSFGQMMQNPELTDIMNQILQDNPADTNAQQMPGVPAQPVQQSQPGMEVVLSQRMIRLRYNSELGNRNIGKEELLIIKFNNLPGSVYIRIHTVDTKHRKAHPYCLIGEHCYNGLYYQKFEPLPENNYSCVCKATIKIPKRQEYDAELSKRKKQMTETLGLMTEEMKKGDYWTTNKNMRECQSICLCVEAFYQIGETFYMLKDITKPLRNAKDGRNFRIYTIRPCSAPSVGIPANTISDSMLIVLSADSYVPKDCEVWFYDDEGWKEKATSINVIKNVLEIDVPAYKKLGLLEPRKVSVEVKDTKENMSTPAVDFLYTPALDEVIINRKRRKAVNWDNIPEEVRNQAGLSVSTKVPGENSREKVRSFLTAKGIGKNRATTNQHGRIPSSSAVSNSRGKIITPSCDTSNESNDAFQSFTAPSLLAPSGSEAEQTTFPHSMDLSHQNLGNLSVGDIPSFVDPNINDPQPSYSLTAESQISKPPDQQDKKKGGFRTVNIKGTNQWVLIDQNNKPILILGSNACNDSEEINEVPSTNLSMPSFGDMATNFQMGQGTGTNFQSNQDMGMSFQSNSNLGINFQSQQNSDNFPSIPYPCQDHDLETDLGEGGGRGDGKHTKVKDTMQEIPDIQEEHVISETEGFDDPQEKKICEITEDLSKMGQEY